MAEHILRIPITESIDAQLVSEITSQSPWVNIPGTFNARDLGGNIRPGFIFRSGTLESVGVEGLATLKDLGIGTVFDLRSETERIKNPEVVLGEDIEGVWTQDKEVEIERGSITLNSTYLALLVSHADAFERVFRHVLECPDVSILIHCTGKDRTGVIAALLHALAGTPLEKIERDYALTRIGIEPQREFLMQKMLGSRTAGGRPIDLSHPRIKMFAEPPADAMATFLRGVNERYGSVEEYLLSVLGFARGDIGVVKRHLRGEQSQS